MNWRAPAWILVGVVAIGLSVMTGRELGLLEKSIPAVDFPPTHSVSTCLEKRSTVALASSDMPIVRAHLELCIQEVSKHLELNDFQIRRLKFLGQYYIEKVTLWMVVFVTVAGVFLSAFQLATSYRLASRSIATNSDTHELTLETGKIVIRSSAIGLMVLFMSLAFFLIFVLNIYKIEEVRQETRATPLQAAQPPAPLFNAGFFLPFDRKGQPESGKAAEKTAQ